MKNKFIFKPLSFSDISLMHHWFNLPHIQKFYSLRQWTETEILDKLTPYIKKEKPILGYIALRDENPIGYVQQCRVSDYPWPHQNLPKEIINHATGVDLFIGDEKLIGQGIGSQMLRSYIEHKVWPEFQYCIVDPDIRNIAAIKCYEKLNFLEHVDIITKDALDIPVTLKLMILKR